MQDIRKIYLAHCAISPLFPLAAEREKELCELQRDHGLLLGARYVQILEGLRAAAAALLKTAPANLSFQRNTTEGICLLANGYPFAAGDRIISYIHEYPANHYPWILQQGRGVSVDLLPDRNVSRSACPGGPCGWDMNDLEKMVTEKTRVVAVSHVQFASGFAADLCELGKFCRDRGIDLIVDAAQSMGCLPLYPEEWGVAAVATSGWKWLMGPVGTGLLYTSREFRDRLKPVMVGAETMIQGQEYLDHRWQPHATAKRFEYSTAPISLAGALEVCLRKCHLSVGIEGIRDAVFQRTELLAERLDREFFSPVLFEPCHRSGILAVKYPGDVEALARNLLDHGVVTSPRAGYIRLAPHYYLAEEEILRAADILNSAGRG